MNPWNPLSFVSTKEVYLARQEVIGIEHSWQQATGVYRTRKEQAKHRLDRAMEAERKLREEYDRLVYTLSAGFGVRLGQRYLGEEAARPAGGRVTFIQETNETELRTRIRDLRRKLSEAPE